MLAIVSPSKYGSLCSFQVYSQTCHFQQQNLKPYEEQLEEVNLSAEFITNALRET